MGVGASAGPEILIIRLSSFGDVILTEPVARALKAAFPKCTITFVTNSDYRVIPTLFGSVDQVVPYNRAGGNRDLEELSARTEFTVAVDLQNNLRSRRLLRGLRTGRTLRHKRQRFLRFLRVHLPRLWRGNLKPVVQTYLDAVRPLGVETEDLTPVLVPAASAVEQARRWLPAGPFIAVCPGGSSEHKRWSDARFRELVRILTDKGHRVALIGAEQDRPQVVAASRDASPEVRTYVGDDIGLIAGLLSLCPVTVTNDSGLMHLAAAVGSRVAAIFGPTSPALGFAPTAPDCRIISLDLDCAPCTYHGNVPCRIGTRACFEDIEAQLVADIVEGMLR